MYPRSQERRRNREATVYLPALGGADLGLVVWLQNIQMLVSVVSRREPKMLRGSSCSEYRGLRVLCHG
jgi:hypothetical protein